MICKNHIKRRFAGLCGNYATRPLQTHLLFILYFMKVWAAGADKLILPYRLFVEIGVNTVGYSRRNQLLRVIVLRHLLVFFRIAPMKPISIIVTGIVHQLTTAQAIGLLYTSVLESSCRSDVIRYLLTLKAFSMEIPVIGIFGRLAYMDNVPCTLLLSSEL